MQDFSVLIKSDFAINDMEIDEIKAEVSSLDGIEIFASNDSNRSGGLDPQVLIALITGGNAVVTALIVGVFNHYNKKQEKKFRIVLELGKESSKIEIEGSDSKELKELLAKSQDKLLELKSIEVQKLLNTISKE
jgi:hypothetical protein